MRSSSSPCSAPLALVALPYLGFSKDEPRGAWFLSETGRRTARLAALVALVATPLLVLADAAILGAAGNPSGGAALLARGVLPTAALLLACGAAFRFVRSRFGATRLEATQALFVFLAVAFAVLTATGIWFRGTGMRLVWPWIA